MSNNVLICPKVVFNTWEDEYTRRDIVLALLLLTFAKGVLILNEYNDGGTTYRK